jgi:hypothetical protein
MLIALFTFMFLGGSQTGMLYYIADTQDTIKVVVESDDRREEALATLKAMKNVESAQNHVVKSVSKDLNETLLSDAATDADIDAIWEDYSSQRESYDLDMLDLRYQLKDQLTREEWRQVFSGD